MSEVKKEVVFGALPKEFIQKQLNKLIEDNKEIFETYNMLAQALQSEVKMNVDESDKETPIVAQDANETE